MELSLYGGRGRRAGRLCGNPALRPLRSFRAMALFLRAPLRPLCLHPPLFLIFVTLPAKGQLSFGWRSPDVPTSLRDGSLGAGAEAPGGRARQGARAWRLAWRAAGPWPLGRSWAILGATPASAGPCLRTAARGGRRRRSGTGGFLRRGLAHPLPTSGQPPKPAQKRPPGLRPMLGRGAPAGLEICALAIHISNMIFGAASTARRRRRALTTASVCCVFFIWGSFAQGLPAGPLCARGSSLHARPCVLLSGAPVAPPEPSGAHPQDRFLSSLFPT